MRSDDQPHTRLDPETATKVVFASMWTPVIMLLLGGFTIAAALSKYDIARRMATFVLSKAGTSPRVVLVTNMFVSMFLSMWISNVAAPVLCYSIIQVSLLFSLFFITPSDDDSHSCGISHPSRTFRKRWCWESPWRLILEAQRHRLHRPRTSSPSRTCTRASVGGRGSSSLCRFALFRFF